MPAQVSILYEANKLCNATRGRAVVLTGRVSILYEANKLCNPRTCSRGRPGRARFQSSTRLTSFATRLPDAQPGVIRTFQSSTRLTSFATLAAAVGDGAVRLVSILYEANKLCNGINPAPCRALVQRFNPLRG